MGTALIADIIHFLAVDAIHVTKSVHLRIPIGNADMTTVLFKKFNKINSDNPHWLSRDRIVLSA